MHLASSPCLSHQYGFPGDLLRLVVFKLNVQTIFYAHLHLDGGVELRIRAERVHHNVHLLDHVIQPTANSGAEEIPAEEKVSNWRICNLLPGGVLTPPYPISNVNSPESQFFVLLCLIQLRLYVYY